ncbi:MAG: cytochrome c [Thermoanaerobaculia bacterium]
MRWPTLFALTLCVLATAGCERFMHSQPKFRPLEKTEFFRDHNSSRPIVEDTIPQGHLQLDQKYLTGEANGEHAMSFPFPITMKVLEQGRDRFDIFCAPCHGLEGDGRGMVPRLGFKQPPSYHTDRLRAAPPGHFVHVMTYGYGVMFDYRDRLTPEERWAVAAYIRALQLSHNARITDVPNDERGRLLKGSS